jgi:His/Glu/Gln/Arg/opine family amino acid ABC transporter permease subunit
MRNAGVHKGLHGFLLPLLVVILLVAGRTGAGAQEPATSGDFSVALTGKYPPFSFSDPASGELAGFDVDVSAEVARRLGRPLRLVQTEWDGILAGLLAGRYDAIIGSMAITEERARRVDFTEPYYVSGAQLFIRDADAARVTGIASLSDGARVGATLGTSYEHYITSEFPNLAVVTYKGEPDIFADMANGRLDGFVTDRLVGMHQIRMAGLAFQPAGGLLYEERIGIPVRKDRPDLLAEINEALAAMGDDGTLAALEAKYFARADASAGERTEVTLSNAAIASRLARGFGVTVLVAVLSLGAGFVLAVPTGLVLHAGPAWARVPTRAIVDFLRGTPVLIQLFFVYFGAPQAGLNLSPLAAAVLTLAVNAAAYMAEVIRAGLLAVPPGQARAARALGMNRVQAFRFVVWPQAFRVALPPLMNSAVALLKDTALVSVISVGEVIREAQSIISITFDPMRYYFLVAVIFFVFTFPLMKLAGRLEERIRRRGFGNA